MAVQVEDFQDWINDQDPESFIAIDDGGLAVVIFASDESAPLNTLEHEYYEIGGILLPEEDE